MFLMLRIESPSLPHPFLMTRHRMRLAPLRAAVAFLAMTAIPVFAPSTSSAQEATPRPGQERITKAQSAIDPPCFCWADGRKIAEGLTACIRTANGRRLAECGRVINLMSWQISEEICPES